LKEITMQLSLIAVGATITPEYLADLHYQCIRYRTKLKAERGRRVNRGWEEAGLLSEEGQAALRGSYRSGSRDWGF
jgi:hypothetical protein